MDWEQEYISKLNHDVQEIKNDMRMQKQDFDVKLESFMNELRNRDNQRIDDMREIRGGIASMNKHVQNLTIVAIAGIGAITVAVIAFVYTAIGSMAAPVSP